MSEPKKGVGRADRADTGRGGAGKVVRTEGGGFNQGVQGKSLSSLRDEAIRRVEEVVYGLNPMSRRNEEAVDEAVSKVQLSGGAKVRGVVVHERTVQMERGQVGTGSDGGDGVLVSQVSGDDEPELSDEDIPSIGKELMAIREAVKDLPPLDRPECGHEEWNDVLGETMRCCKEVHGNKVKHGDWRKV